VEEAPSPLCYYVDEAGDGVLFRSGGQDRLADPGASRFFIMGMVSVVSPLKASAVLHGLRESLKANPLYASISSFAKARGFHAKDDHPEIRSKVFDLIIGLDFKIFAVVKDMRAVRDYVRRRNRMDTAYRYHPNELTTSPFACSSNSGCTRQRAAALFSRAVAKPIAPQPCATNC